MTFVQDKSKNNNAHVQMFELRDLQELRKPQYFPEPKIRTVKLVVNILHTQIASLTSCLGPDGAIC